MLTPADAVVLRRYVGSACHAHPAPSLGIGPAILRGLRDLGYRDSASAICALVDNAIDAQATEVDIIFEIAGAAIIAVAVMDNGIGMVPEMMRAACAVGATCPLGDGPHLARSGFGLPSAPFAIGRQFELISSPSSAFLAGVLFDLENLSPDDIHISEATRVELPTFVLDYLRREHRSWTAGTIIVLRDLDRLAPSTPTRFAEQLHAKLGHVFGRFASRMTLRVEGKRVVPIDPLFLLADVAEAALAGDKAEDTGTISVAMDRGGIHVRTALLPPGFVPTEGRRPQMSQPANDRAAIIRETNGLIISRLGRRLTVLPSTPLFHFSNVDRSIRVEVDFPPELDDLFAPSLSLQQVQVSHAVWSALRTHGVARHLEFLRRRVSQQRKRQWGLDATSADQTPASQRRRNRCQKKG